MTALQGTYIERFVEGAAFCVSHAFACASLTPLLPQVAARCRRSFSACCPRFASWMNA